MRTIPRHGILQLFPLVHCSGALVTTSLYEPPYMSQDYPAYYPVHPGHAFDLRFLFIERGSHKPFHTIYMPTPKGERA
ncbi:hypothetical protein BX600DRAFT_24057 [Xylariales sp. PMI_506]|nr:hypothetical protein BX600DRAFT_24057 [Xylariales sp. PMI_506]